MTINSMAQLAYEAAAAVNGDTDPWKDWSCVDHSSWEAAVNVVLDPESDPHRVFERAAARSAALLLTTVGRCYYWNPVLGYHNWAHVERMLSTYARLWGPPHPEMHLAIVYHDAIYVPGAPVGLNEALSAHAFEHEYRQRFGDAQIIDTSFVAEMIRATTVLNHCAPLYKPPSRYIARLMDCDLGTLALDYQSFVAQQDGIIAEKSGSQGLAPTVLADNRARVAEFLLSFVDDERPYVYHTSEARDAMEEQARYNIGRYNDEHGSQE